VVLLLLPWVVALVLVRRHHHLDVGAVTILVSASLGLPVIWLTWAMYRDAKKSDTQAGGLTLPQVADQLAVAVGAQWEAEAAIRRLNDPYPLPVSWDPADASLTDDWQSLVMLAESGAGWPTPPPEGTWAAGPDDLSGAGSDLVSKLAAVPTGRLVVLGEPGAGKTMLMVRLVLDLLARRTAGDPVPILASIASWDPADQDLQAWLATQLMIDHPALAAAPPAGRQESTQAAALLASELILMILDGLDEIPEEVRGPAIGRINDALRPGQHLVLACRTREYQDAVKPEGGAEVTLQGAAAVQLNPINADAVRGYLCPATSSSRTKARWGPVLAVLGTAAPAGQALKTPLMVGLARAIYNPRPGELTGELPKPEDLCDLPDREAVELRLFDAFIPAAYRQRSASRRKAYDAEKWFVFLARHLEHKIARPDLAWWQLPLAVPAFPFLVAVTIGVVYGILGGITFWLVLMAGAKLYLSAWVGGAIGVAVGVLAGFLAWITGIVMPRDSRPLKHAHGNRRSLFSSSRLLGSVAVAGVMGGVVAWVVTGFGFWAVAGLYVAGGAVLGWSYFVGSAQLDIRSVASPLAVLARDRRNAIFVGLAFAAMITAVVAVSLWVIATTAAVVVGVVLGVGFGISSSFTAAWSSYAIARVWLALRHRLPWSLMSFLTDAHQRGVLRQAGAVYQFRHIELQHRLATRPAKSTSGLRAPGSGPVA
jgi:hypothetical protein